MKYGQLFRDIQKKARNQRIVLCLSSVDATNCRPFSRTVQLPVRVTTFNARIHKSYQKTCITVKQFCFAVTKHKLLQNYAVIGMSSALFWVVMQSVVEIHYRRFGTTYESRLKGSRLQT